MAALTVLCVYLASVLPAGRLFLYCLSSVFASVVIIEAGLSTGWAFYAATFIIMFIILPDRLRVLPFAAFFGYYACVKYLAEKVKNLVAEYIIKLAVFNAAVVLFYFAAIKTFFAAGLDPRVSPWLLLAAAEIIFFIYDYVFTLFIDYYKKNIRHSLKW